MIEQNDEIPAFHIEGLSTKKRYCLNNQVKDEKSIFT